MRTAVEAAQAAVGPLDRVVHCAGIARLGRLQEQSSTDIERVWRVNYLGTVHVARAVVTDMTDRGTGDLMPWRRPCSNSSAGITPTSPTPPAVCPLGRPGIRRQGAARRPSLRLLRTGHHHPVVRPTSGTHRAGPPAGTRRKTRGERRERIALTVTPRRYVRSTLGPVRWVMAGSVASGAAPRRVAETPP
ncbi:SDR family NAD(P)-dependent oxidoreductase [Streptomyces albulus]|nr:SDR family NAD(P)-dependent oxidoreductase [Streptomyces noursei]